MQITEKIKNGTVYFDGGMGTLLQGMGLKPGELPELWGMMHPDKLIFAHEQYLLAGCDVIATNTFGANSLKFNGEEHTPHLLTVVQNAIMCARTAIGKVSGKKRYIALDIGPLGRLIKPLGDLDFEEAVRIFSETIKIGAEFGVDCILIETMNDSYETKAAVLAAKETCDLPIFVTNTYDEDGKLMTGADCGAMVAMLEGLGVSALGVNCGLGPDKLIGVVEKLTEYASIPVIVNPNAGLPAFDGEKTVYNVSPEEFSEQMKAFLKMGVHGLGGCCGTTPEHIAALVQKTKDLEAVPITDKKRTVISSYTHCVEFGKSPVLIGERINPTGKSLMKAALRENNMEYILNEGLSQKESGAHVLDVNVGLPDIDEKRMLSNVVFELQSVCDLPLQIDTSDKDAMEAALRIYNGKPMINSVCGKKESMEAVFPLAAKYGGLIVALTLDENGIPDTAEGRFRIAEKIYHTAETYGISRKDIIIDTLAMTISADTTSARTTLSSIDLVKRAGGLTSLGVSNVSFGLPERENIHTTFFAMALSKGLDAAIMNPRAKKMMDVYYSFQALHNLDPMCERYIAYAAETKSEQKEPVKEDKKSNEEALKSAIIKGLKDEAKQITEKLIKEKDSLSVVNECIIPALDIVGKGFENKTMFLPQLLMSAESAKASFDVLKSTMKQEKSDEKAFPIVIATVKGDIHDIGKNIVKVLLLNYGFDVTDLGKDVPPEKILEVALEKKAKLVGLSALMTTTVPAMEETIKLLREHAPHIKTVVGGAVLTQSYADMIGADKYAKDAMEAVRFAESLKK